MAITVRFGLGRLSLPKMRRTATHSREYSAGNFLALFLAFCLPLAIVHLSLRASQISPIKKRRRRKRRFHPRARLARDFQPANIRKVSISVQQVESPSSKLDASYERRKASLLKRCEIPPNVYL